MPLTGEEKTQIAQGTSLVTQAVIAEAALLGSGGTALLALPFLPLIAGLTAYFNRVRFPRISTGDIARTAEFAATGSVISQDPFFGDVVVSQPDQAPFLAELIRESALRRVRADQDTSRLFLERRAFIEASEETAQERGFATAIDPNLRGGVFRPAVDSPLQFIEGNFLP